MLICLENPAHHRLTSNVDVLGVYVLDEVVVALVVGDLLEMVLREEEEVLAEGDERLASHVAGELSQTDPDPLIDPLQAFADLSFFLLPLLAPILAFIFGRPEETLVGFLLSQVLNQFLDEAVLAGIVVQVMFVVAAADEVIPGSLTRSLGRPHVDFDAGLAESAGRVDSSRDLFTALSVGPVTVDWVPAAVDESKGSDFVAEPRLIDVSVAVPNGGVGDLFDFLLGEAGRGVGDIISPPGILLEVLPVVPRLDVDVVVFFDEALLVVFFQTPRDETLGGFHGRGLVAAGPDESEEPGDVVIREKFLRREHVVFLPLLLVDLHLRFEAGCQFVGPALVLIAGVLRMTCVLRRFNGCRDGVLDLQLVRLLLFDDLPALLGWLQVRDESGGGGVLL